MDILAIAVALGRIFIKGAVLYGAAKYGYDEADLGALEHLFEAGGVLRNARSATPSAPTRIHAVHLALITQAFGEACDDHWGGNSDLAPGLVDPSRLRRLFMSDKRKERIADIQSRLKRALESLGKSTQRADHSPLDPRHSLSGDPIASFYYNALWEAFNNTLLESDDQGPLIDIGGEGQAKLHFEETVRMAYHQALTSPSGKPLADYLLQEETERPNTLRKLLATRMATWGERHVFGDMETPGIPYIPMAEIYVEPRASFGSGEKKRIAPVRALIGELIEKHGIVIVRADFGHGKSLTAKMLAWALAKRYCEDTQTPSPDLFFPIYIKCGEDFESHRPRMGDTIRNALRNQAASQGISLLSDDPAFQKPDGRARVLYLIDGLDEVMLTPSELEHFFSELRGHTSERHWAIVFSRQGALPEEDRLKGIPILDLLGLSTRGENNKPRGQAGEWLQRWNGLSGNDPISIEELEDANLHDIAATPILLLMTALTWDRKRLNHGKINRAEMYERFFVRIARGKLEQDPDGHGPVKEASRQLRTRLVELEILPKSCLKDDDQLPQAMLWLMSRVAWEWMRLDQRGEHLSTHELTTILKEELNIRNDPRSEELIRIGILLAMQANLRGGNNKILFGHKSFREFLVARYWAGQIGRILQARRAKEKEELNESLLGAQLMDAFDGSIHFLIMILNGSIWSDRQREQIIEWAEERFNDETPRWNKEVRWADDLNPWLREAALVIGSHIKGSPGIKAEKPDTLRSLLAWFWLKNEVLYFISAPRFRSEGAELREAHLHNADFQGASLQGADLRGANMGIAHLNGANLRDAKLENANLNSANLSGTDLSQADLEGADLGGADLSRANLGGANLTGTDLTGTDLTGANLEGANLIGARYSTQYTRWPEGFDPIAAGAINIDPDPLKPPTKK